MDTVWDVVPARQFLHQIDDIIESIWEPFALEFYATNKMVYVCMAASDTMIDILSTGVYSWMPDAEVRDVEDYTQIIRPTTLVVGAEMKLWRPEIYPLKDYKAIATDSMAPIVTPLSQLAEHDQFLYQVIVRPMRDTAALHLKLALKRTEENFVNKFRARTLLKKDLATNSAELIKTKCSSNLASITIRLASPTTSPR